MIISKFLKDNKSIYGIHFAGNYGYVDSWQYLEIPDDFERDKILSF